MFLHHVKVEALKLHRFLNSQPTVAGVYGLIEQHTVAGAQNSLQRGAGAVAMAAAGLARMGLSGSDVNKSGGWEAGGGGGLISTTLPKHACIERSFTFDCHCGAAKGNRAISNTGAGTHMHQARLLQSTLCQELLSLY